MSLFEFATTAEDGELYCYGSPSITTIEQFYMLMPELPHTKETQPLILWADQDKICRNNMTYDEARMFMCFVALATGEEQTQEETEYA